MSALRSAGRELSCLGVGQASVRSCLLMLLVACVLPATLVAAVLIVDAYHEGRANAFERGTVSSRAIMGEVDDMLVAATAGLQALATSPSLAAGDLAGFHAQALRALPAQAGNNIVLSDLAGQQLLNTLVPFGAPLPRHGNPALQRAVVATGQPAVSDLFTGGVTRRPLVAMEVPVLVDGRVSYTLATGVFPERFAAALSRSRQRPEWVVVLFDRTGTVVSRTHLPERYVGQKGAPALVAAMAQAEQGVVETPTLEGTPVLAAFSRSSKTGWTVAVGIPEQTLLARVQRWVAWLAASTVGVLLLGLVLASFIARRVAGAFAALVPSAEALGRGERVQPVQLPLREADTVARALARASALLQTRTHERDLAAHAGAAARAEAQRMTHEAHHDALTQLANRALFHKALRQHLAACARHGGHLTVLYVDLDDFKPVNDLHGHQVGDELLCSFAARLVAGVRATDLVARLGGDEFAVLLQGLAPQDAKPIVAALAERLSKPYAVRDLQLRVSACIGVAGCPDNGRTAEELLAAADAAMYTAKASGKGRYSISGFGGL